MFRRRDTVLQIDYCSSDTLSLGNLCEAWSTDGTHHPHRSQTLQEDPLTDPAHTDEYFLGLAIEQAQIGWEEGGVPIGAALVHDGEVLAVGRNRRVQMDSAIRHGETDCIERAGRLPASVYRKSVLYTTLSPCFMCAGTALLYEIPRIVIGENRSFEMSESLLREHGVQLDVVDDPACLQLMERMLVERPGLWLEDIGEEA